MMSVRNQRDDTAWNTLTRIIKKMWTRHGVEVNELTWLFFYLCPSLALEATSRPFTVLYQAVHSIVFQATVRSVEKKKKKRTLFKSKPWAKPEPCVLYGLPLFSRGVLKECTMFLGCCFLTEFILCLRCLLLKTKGQCLYQSLGSLSALV